MSPFLLGFGLFGVLIHGEVISILNNVLVCLLLCRGSISLYSNQRSILLVMSMLLRVGL